MRRMRFNGNIEFRYSNCSLQDGALNTGSPRRNRPFNAKPDSYLGPDLVITAMSRAMTYRLLVYTVFGVHK